MRIERDVQRTQHQLVGCIVRNAHNTVFEYATEWCQRYLPCCQPASDVAEDLGRFLCGVYRPGEWLWIDSNGRNGIPKRASLVVNFHRSVIIAELWRLEVARRQKVLIFFLRFGNTTSYSKIFKNLLIQKFLSRHWSLCSNFMKFGGREIGEIVRCLSDKKKTKFRLSVQLSLLRGSRSKYANASIQ